MSHLQRSLLVGLCLCLYLLADGAAASSNTTSTSAPSNNNNTSGNATNVTDVQVTTFTSTDTVAPTSTTGAPTPAPTPAPPTPVPPTPVPPTPVPTGGSWTDVPSTMAPVLSTDAPTTTSAPTTTPAPPVCDASPFYCTATAAPQASCFLRTQAYIASLSCRCVGEEVRLPVVSIGASSQTFSLLFTSDLRLTATVYHAWCPTGSDPTWNTASITWTITTPAGIKVSPTGSILTGPSLFVPAGRLPINTKYTITVAAIVSKTAVKVTGFGNVTVSSVAPTPVISIVGGNRVASANVPLRIALDIEDAFLQQNAVKWSCCQVQDALSTTCLQFCNPPLDALSLFTSATLSLTPPGGYFTPAMMRIFATYSNIVTSISVQIVNSTVPQPIIFMPQAGYRRADSAISIGASWSSVPYSTTVQWLINGTAPGRNIATASDDGTSLTILAGSYNPGTVLLISVALLQGSTTVGTSSDYLVIESLPTTGTCVITSTDTQPLGGTSTLQMAVSGWQATSSFPTLALRVGFIDDAGVTQIISASETPIDATGRASTTFTAPLVSSFITAQQRSAPLTFTAQIIDSDRKLLVGRTTCTVTVYSFALTSGLPDVANAIVAKLTSSSSSSATADVLPNARNLVVIAASMQNATQVTLTNVALNSLITSLTQSPVNTLSNSVRLGTLRLAQGLLSTFSSNSTVLAQAVSVRTSTQSSWFALLSRFFRAEAATGNAAPPFATSTAGLYNSLISSFVPTAASTGQVDVSAMLSSDPNAASTLLACVTAIPFAAVDASSTWQGFAALVGIATTAAPLSVTPFDIASWTSGTASAISASKAYVYTALPPLGALSTQFVATTAAANSVLSLDSSLILLRVSLSVVNVTLPNNLGVLLRDQLAMPSTTTNGQFAGSYFMVSDTLAFINVTTDADDFQSVFASGSSIGTIRFDQWPSIVSTAALKRPDLAGNQTQLVQQIQCQQIRDGALLQTTTTVVASASISCSKVVPNAAYALWIFRPASLDVVSVVTTTPAPTSAPPVVTVIQVQASSDNAMQSLTIVLSTVGSLVLLALIGVAVLLVFKIRGQKEQQEVERENRTKLLEFHEVKNASTLDEIPSNRPRASVRDPSDNSSFLRTDVSDLVSPIRRSELGSESIARSDFFIKPVSFAVPSPLPPRVFIDEELQFVPRKRPGAVVNVENDPTPWL